MLLEIKINESSQDKNPWWEYEGHDHVANNSSTTVEHSTVCSTDLKVSRCEGLSGKYLARDSLKRTCGQSTVNGTSCEHCVGHTGGTGLLPAAGHENDRDIANNCHSSASLRCRAQGCVTRTFPSLIWQPV